jgi:hypothetical protein
MIGGACGKLENTRYSTVTYKCSLRYMTRTVALKSRIYLENRPGQASKSTVYSTYYFIKLYLAKNSRYIALHVCDNQLKSQIMFSKTGH